MTRLRKRFLDCRQPQPLTMEECTQYAERLIAQQRDVNFHIGDLSRYAAAAWPETWHQIFPVEDPSTSPGLIPRTSGVCRAYPPGNGQGARGHLQSVPAGRGQA